MSHRIARQSKRRLTPEEKVRVAEVRRMVDGEQEEILRRGREILAEELARKATLHDVRRLLKAERLSQGLTLTDIQQRSGGDPPALSRLENEADANPTVTTLTRYADALGKQLIIALVDPMA
ncbi:MAG: helix-turn-helix transcriptional regulator [Pirellulaceae bacterium]|nr:helix-turn-helix transcriptional regulator [Pirellulaceae bacterium]